MPLDPQQTYNVAIVDDHKLFRQGVRYALKPFKKINEIMEAQNGKEAIELLRQKNCDVMFMDIIMPVLDGIHATREIVKEFPDVSVIALSMSDDETSITRMIEAGASGYLLKNTDGIEMMQAIDVVYSGQHYYSEKVSAKLHSHLMDKRKEREQFLNDNLLSERELEILELICEEYSNIEIGEKLFLSKRTVDGHRNIMLRKTNSRNTAGLVRFAIREGYFKEK
jgi:DNA-binding NarL/FixJ family response regulator